MKSRYITPVVTIFDEQGRIDPEQNTQIYDFIKNHVSGFVVMGSTGEFFSLNMENARQMIKTCSEFSRGDMKVYAGASRMDVNESISLANYAWEQGLDGVMIISPYYFPLDDEAIFDFYSTIASQTPAHIFIYNFPERTGYSVSPEICLRLADKYPNIIGMKDTVPDAFHAARQQKVRRCRRLLQRPDRARRHLHAGRKGNLRAGRHRRHRIRQLADRPEQSDRDHDHCPSAGKTW